MNDDSLEKMEYSEEIWNKKMDYSRAEMEYKICIKLDDLTLKMHYPAVSYGSCCYVHTANYFYLMEIESK